MKLVGLHGSGRVAICAQALDLAGITYESVNVFPQDLKSETVTAHNAQGKVPVLVTPEGPIAETTAILRYVARTSGKLYGASAYETALVDQWLSWYDSEFIGSAGPLLLHLYAFQQGPKAVDSATHRGNVIAKLRVVNDHLKGKHFLVGNSITIADLPLLNLVTLLFAFTLSEKDRNEIPNVVAYVTAWSQTAESKRFYGAKLRLAQAPWGTPKVEVPKPEAPKKEPKAEKPKKEEEEDIENPPKPKDPVFPETKFNLMDFKTAFINEPDHEKALADFWGRFVDGEWSLWHLKYLKYPGECEIIYRTNNLLRTFLSRLENVRRFIFGTHFVLGDEPKLEVEGLWLVRGPALFEGITEIDVYDTYQWTKLDPTTQATKDMVKDFWCHRKEDEEKVQGHTIRTFKWIK